MILTHIGIDVSKALLHAAILIEGKFISAEFQNNSEGHALLLKWAKKTRQHSELRFCLESTGAYSLGVALYLQDKGEHVSVENPRMVKSLAIGLGRMQKTDKADAKTIALYSFHKNPRRWALSDPKARELHDLYVRLEQLSKMLQAERNRQENQHLTKEVIKSLKKSVSSLEKAVKTISDAMDAIIESEARLKAYSDALQKKIGVGAKTARTLIIEIGHPDNYENAKNCAAHAGLNPKRVQSGPDEGKTHLSNIGKKQLRGALFWPVIAAMSHDPDMKAFAKRLSDKGKNARAVRGACTRKFLMQCYGIMRKVEQAQNEGAGT